MKRCEMREVHTWSVCVELQCDICGRKAEHPENGTFEWGSAGSAAGTLNWFYTIDGDDNPDELNFCYECADALADAIRNRNLVKLARLCEGGIVPRPGR